MTIHSLPASADTVRVGLIDSRFPAVLEIDDGDELALQTWGMWGHAVKPGDSIESLLEIRKQHAGRGPHSLTGPVAVRGAKPGMCLKVEILELQLSDFGYNLLLPKGQTRGLLADAFDEGQVRYFKLDTRHMTTELLPGLTLPLRPFLGIMGVAPDDQESHISSIPGPFGGNIDCPDLTTGSTLYLPVFAEGALFYAGDAHAMQGCGEVNQTALETSMEKAHLRLSLLPELKLKRPRAETREHWITMGFDPDLRVAARQAVEDMVELIAAKMGLTAAEAYVLCSLQVDLMITQVVNGNNGVHARLPKALVAQRNPA